MWDIMHVQVRGCKIVVGKPENKISYREAPA